MKRLFAVLIMLSLLCVLCGCAEQPSVFVTPETTGEAETVSLDETSDTEKGPEPETESETIPEIETVTTSESSIPVTETIAETKPVSTETVLDAPVTTQKTETEKAETSTPPIIEKQTEQVTNTVKTEHATSISFSFDHYESKNEKAPFVLGSPLYGILYSGKRSQIGDSITLYINVSPVNHTDRLMIEVSNGLEYSLSGNTLRVTVKEDGNYGTGRISVYALADNGSISANADHSFVIDPAGDPFADMAPVLSDYIRLKGMQYTPFSEGYTASDPSKSITHYAGAPAWDDMINKSSSGWKKQCFDLIDRYKSMGFSKVNFIITDISVGFSAAI